VRGGCKGEWLAEVYRPQAAARIIRHQDRESRRTGLRILEGRFRSSERSPEGTFKGDSMIEKSVNVGNRPVSAVEATSAVERSASTRADDKQQSVERRERKDSAKVSPEARALLDAERRERES